MLETLGNDNKKLDRETADSYIDRLSSVCQKAFESYHAVRERNDKVLNACRMLEAEGPADTHLALVEKKLAHAEEIAKQIVEDVHYQAIAIVECATGEVQGIHDSIERMLSDVQYRLKAIA